MIILFILSVFCFIASLAAHFSTFFGINPQHVFPQVWLLHILIFIVLIGAMFFWQKISKKESVNSSEIISRNSPGWMKMLVIAFFVYAIFNFLIYAFVFSGGGVPGIHDGKKVIHSHGRIIRELTDKEYQQQKIYLIRGFSGHWMLFHAAGMMILYSCIRAKNRTKSSQQYYEL